MFNQFRPIEKDVWPLLLKNYSKMESIGNFSKLICKGIFPFSRTVKSYVKNGIINLDKPNYTTFNQVIKLIKQFLKISKVEYSQETNFKINGCFIIFLEKAIRLVKTQLKYCKKLVAVFKFNYINKKQKIEFFNRIEAFRGEIFQCFSTILNTKRQLRIANIYTTSIQEFYSKQKTCIIEISCDSNIYFKNISSFFFSKLGNNYKLLELRQIRWGCLSENINLTTLHDLIDSNWFYYSKKIDFYIKKVIMPLEILLTCYKRIVIRNSSINSICYGAKLMACGIIRAERNIAKNDEILIISLKGEAVAIAISIINTITLNKKIQGCVCRTKDIIMNKDEYPKNWGIGTNRIKKKLNSSCGLRCFVNKKSTDDINTWNFQ